MNNQDNFFNDEYSQVTLSLELLILLEWLARNGEEVIEKVIEFALKSGLEHEIRNVSLLYHNNTVPESAQEAIPAFFDMLEGQLRQKIDAMIQDSTRTNRLNSTIEHIDPNICDTDIIHSSIQRATSQADNAPQKNARELLIKELLRRWKPQNKKMLN